MLFRSSAPTGASSLPSSKATEATSTWRPHGTPLTPVGGGKVEVEYGVKGRGGKVGMPGWVVWFVGLVVGVLGMV